MTKKKTRKKKAKKVTKKKTTRKKKPKPEEDLPIVRRDSDGNPTGITAEVSLGKVSVGEKTVSVRANLSLPHDVARLVLAQATLSIVLDVVDGELFEASIPATAMTKKVLIGFEEEQAVTLSMARDTVDVAQLSQFANKAAKLTADRQGPAEPHEATPDENTGDLFDGEGDNG